MRTAYRLSRIWLCVGIILLAFVLRLYGLGNQSVWYDEGLSVYYARQSLQELLSLVATSDHPPLYFLLLHAWLRLAAFGQPAVEFLVRFPSLLAGVLLIPLIYVLGCRLLNPRAALTAAALTAIAPFHVWYAQETRMYTLVVLLTAMASYLFVKALSPTSNTQCPIPNTQYPISIRSWFSYTLTTVLALYTHFYTTFIFLAHAVFVTWWAWRRGEWRIWRAWATALAVALAVFLPWGSRVAGQLRANDTYWRGTLDLGRTVVRTARALAVGETLSGSGAVVTTLAYLLLASLGLVMLLTRTSLPRPRFSSLGRRDSRAVAAFLLAYILVPLVTLLALAYRRPKFAPRYLLTVAPGLALLAGGGVITLDRWHRRIVAPALATGLVGIVVAGSGLSLWRHYFDTRLYKPDWRAVADYMATHASPRDAVVIVAGHTAPAFDFYNPLGLDVYPIPQGLLPRVSDPVETADVTTVLNRVVAEGHDRVWLILWQEPLADPRRITLEQLFDHGRRLGVNAPFHGLAVLLFDLPPGTRFGPPQPQHPLRARFGDVIELYGYDLWPEAVRPGERLTLRLYWRAVAPVGRDYTAFTQLLSSDDRIVGQHDRRLGGDLYPTSRWPVGEPVRETYQLTVAPDTPPGSYRLIAGVYLRETGQRLPVVGDRAVGDYVVVVVVGVTGNQASQGNYVSFRTLTQPRGTQDFVHPGGIRAGEGGWHCAPLSTSTSHPAHHTLSRRSHYNTPRW